MKNESSTTSVEDPKKNSDSANKENIMDIANSGIVTDEDREADRDASEKLAGMIEERLKTNPLPPPPPQTAPDGSGKSNSDLPVKSRDGNSDIDLMRNGEFLQLHVCGFVDLFVVFSMPCHQKICMEVLKL